MTERYKFFDSIEGDSREYDADTFAEFFRGFIKDGTQFNNSNALKVTANGSNMIISILPGFCFIQGYQYQLTEEMSKTVESADATYNRIDYVVARLDTNIEQRKISIEIIKGTSVKSPVVPFLIQDLDTQKIYDFPLAKILVPAGRSYLESSNITDMREEVKIINPYYRQIFVSTEDPDISQGKDGDIFIKYAC